MRGNFLARQWAAENGHLEIIQFLHTSGLDKDDNLSVCPALHGGHLEVVQYLTEVQPACVNSITIKNAADHGDVAILKYLHERFHAFCEGHTMYYAAAVGEFDAVKYLNDHCDQPQSFALIGAAKYGDLRIVQYLVEKRTDGCLVAARKKAKQRGHPLVDAYLTSLIDPAAPCNQGESCASHVRRLCQK